MKSRKQLIPRLEGQPPAIMHGLSWEGGIRAMEAADLQIGWA